MTGSTAKKILDPMGETIQSIVRGRRGAGRVAIRTLWPDIEEALNAGLSVTAIWQALSQSGMVSIGLRSFTRQLKAHREGPRRGAVEAKPEAERLSPTIGGAAVEVRPAAPAPVVAAEAEAKPAEVKPARPNRPWRTGPYQPPDPNAVFKPRDPLADDEGE